MSSRDWQRISQVLALLLVVLVGAAAIVAFLKPGTPAATTPPSNIAVVPTPTDPLNGPSVGPSKTPKPPKSPKPTATSTPTPRATPTPDSSETAAPPTSRPSDSAAVPPRTIRFVGLGFDGAAATT